jgi:hypothetical protein
MKIQTMAFMALFISIIETVIFIFQASISNFFLFIFNFFFPRSRIVNRLSRKIKELQEIIQIL